MLPRYATQRLLTFLGLRSFVARIAIRAERKENGPVRGRQIVALFSDVKYELIHMSIEVL